MKRRLSRPQSIRRRLVAAHTGSILALGVAVVAVTWGSGGLSSNYSAAYWFKGVEQNVLPTFLLSVQRELDAQHAVLGQVLRSRGIRAQGLHQVVAAASSAQPRTVIAIARAGTFIESTHSGCAIPKTSSDEDLTLVTCGDQHVLASVNTVDHPNGTAVVIVGQVLDHRFARLLRGLIGTETEIWLGDRLLATSAEDERGSPMVAAFHEPVPEAATLSPRRPQTASFERPYGGYGRFSGLEPIGVGAKSFSAYAADLRVDDLEGLGRLRGLRIRIWTPSETMRAGLAWGIVWVGAALLLIGGGGLLFLRQRARELLSPLWQLTIAARRIAEGDRDAKVSDACYAEVQDTMAAFNFMVDQLREEHRVVQQRSTQLMRANAGMARALDELRQTQSKLIRASHYAGMAEVASGVLHNVGNVLNSVNVGTEVVEEHLRRSRPDRLRLVAGRLVEGVRTDGLGTFLQKVADAETQRTADCLAQLDTVRRHVEHLKVIIARQQGYAKAARMIETVPVDDLVQDALILSGLSGFPVEVRCGLPEPAEVTLERHRVLQILVNLLANARHAVTDAGVEPRIELCLAVEDGQLAMTVCDNGIGISEEHMARMFTHGFTTRKHGHGFGLHNSQLAAQEMNGSLMCASDGRMQGAAFTLAIPYLPAERRHQPAGSTDAHQLSA